MDTKQLFDSVFNLKQQKKNKIIFMNIDNIEWWCSSHRKWNKIKAWFHKRTNVLNFEESSSHYLIKFYD